MKIKTLIFFLLFLPSVLFSQWSPWESTHVYTTFSLGLKQEQFLRAEFEQREKFVIFQLAYQTNFVESDFHAKVGFGYVHNDFRIYGYLPYPNIKLSGENKWKYNTPFCVEAFWKNFSVNVDIYKDKVMPALRLRLKVF